jgi:hypothetical protein
VQTAKQRHNIVHAIALSERAEAPLQIEDRIYWYQVASVNSIKTIRKFPSHQEQKEEVNRYWQSLSPGQRLAAVWDATATAYALKGIPYDPTRRSTPTLTRIQRRSS